jgi:hypothetical protein
MMMMMKKVITPGRLVVTDVLQDFDASDCRVVPDFIKVAEETSKSDTPLLCPLAEQTLD